VRADRGLGLALRYAVAAAVTVVFLFPIYWLVTIAFKTPDEIFASPPVWWPGSLQLSNFAVLFRDGDAWTVWNSLVIATLQLPTSLTSRRGRCSQASFYI
jgi:multiple sugar transport system permease protein